jgi:hypothetical protein
MPYITVDVDTDEVLNELDIDEVVDYAVYNAEYDTILMKLDEDNIAQFLIDNGHIVFTDYTIIKDFLEKKDAYGLMNFVHKTYNAQIGELTYAELV